MRCYCALCSNTNTCTALGLSSTLLCFALLVGSSSLLLLFSSKLHVLHMIVDVCMWNYHHTQKGIERRKRERDAMKERVKEKRKWTRKRATLSALFLFESYSLHNSWDRTLLAHLDIVHTEKNFSRVKTNNAKWTVFFFLSLLNSFVWYFLVYSRCSHLSWMWINQQTTHFASRLRYNEDATKVSCLGSHFSFKRHMYEMFSFSQIIGTI